MNHWLLKTEPTSYSIADLEHEGQTTWDGVRNPVALKHMAGMARDDQVLIYHTGSEKAIVGLARVRKAAYPDPKGADPKLLVVDLAYVGRVPEPVTLKRIKADPAFAEFALVRQARLSVMPVPAELWTRLRTMGGIA